MKKIMMALGCLLLSACLTGCAYFGTTQTDLSYGADGKPQRQVVTKAKAWTLFSARSKLAQWKATQTDKSQGATVGGLEQQSIDTTTNLAVLIGTATGTAIKTLAK